MIINKEDVLKKLNKIKEEIKMNYKVKSIGILSSYVNNKQKVMIDIDFLVEFEDDADSIHFIGLSRYLEEVLKDIKNVIIKKVKN